MNEMNKYLDIVQSLKDDAARDLVTRVLHMHRRYGMTRKMEGIGMDTHSKWMPNDGVGAKVNSEYLWFEDHIVVFDDLHKAAALEEGRQGALDELCRQASQSRLATLPTGATDGLWPERPYCIQWPTPRPVRLDQPTPIMFEPLDFGDENE